MSQRFVSSQIGKKKEFFTSDLNYWFCKTYTISCLTPPPPYSGVRSRLNQGGGAVGSFKFVFLKGFPLKPKISEVRFPLNQGGVIKQDIVLKLKKKKLWRLKFIELKEGSHTLSKKIEKNSKIYDQKKELFR